MSAARTATPAVPALGPDVRNLDLLRAFAVSCVFLAHLFLFLIRKKYIPVAYPEIWDILLQEIGHIGVLYFFVHTALVLMLSLDRTPARKSVLNFYVRRLFRIYPLAIVCVLSVLFIRVPQVPEVYYVSFSWLEIVSNLLLVQNLTRVSDVIMPLWTLTREVQMYLALPLVYWLVRKFATPLVSLILWLVFFALTPHSSLVSCLPCFMGGVFAYQLAREKVFRMRAWAWPVAILALMLFHIALAVTVLPDFRNDFIFCMLLGAVIPNVVDLNKSWLTEGARIVAKYSYGVYLFHTPIIWFSFVKLGFLPVPGRYAALILLMVAIPVLGCRLVEAPMIEIGRRWAARLSASPEPSPDSGKYTVVYATENVPR